MKLPFIIENLQSKYCLGIFILMLGVGYLLIPKEVFAHTHVVVVIPFILLFAFSTACAARSIKERILLSENRGSLIGIISSIIGITTLQVCGISGPMCGASVGVGILSVLFPGAIITLLRENSIGILISTMILQVVSLYMMRCFVRKH